MSDPASKTTEPWWLGTAIPTGRYRLKSRPNGNLKLQHLIQSLDGRRNHWNDVPQAEVGDTDDDPIYVTITKAAESHG